MIAYLYPASLQHHRPRTLEEARRQIDADRARLRLRHLRVEGEPIDPARPFAELLGRRAEPLPLSALEVANPSPRLLARLLCWWRR